MVVSVIGTGYVGLVTGTCFSELGFQVNCVDIDEQKIRKLKKGIIPIYEPGLEELVKKNIKKGRLKFTCNTKSSIKKADIVFSAVGTPAGKDHRADLRFIHEVARSFGESICKYTILVTKSTVPVGTHLECEKIIEEEIKKRKLDIDFDIVSNPEFLREGSAIEDTMYPDRIVIGTNSPRAREIMNRLYAPWKYQTKNPLFFTSRASAEIIKYAANSFLATKISFINEIANFCELSGADITEVAKGIGLDKRIGHRFLHAGIGYGGSCFPKDVKALIKKGKDLGYDFKILKAIEERNERQRQILIQKVMGYFPNLKGITLAVWGLSFKPKTDDIRCAPAIDIIQKLIDKGAKIKCFDPVAMNNVKKHFGTKISYCQNQYECTKNADALLLLTEWDEFRNLDFKTLSKYLKNKVIFDGRNIYNPQELTTNGFHYLGIGRSTEIEPISQKPRKINKQYSPKTNSIAIKPT